jgi:glycosyltransferase involved in cell wall biosynthesis
VKLSVNILTWNTLKTLHETIHILKNELRDIDSELIIVDNGSIDGCQDYATIKNPKNLGISKGKNQGIDISQGDYILLIDGDVVPVPNSIKLLVKHLDENPDCMAIGFLPNKFSNNINGGHETFCHKLDPIMQHRGHCIYYGIYRKEVFQHIRFDEEYGVGYGYEDLDSYMQMEAKGIKQWVAGMNKLEGKYFHAINSSINNKNCLGFEEYMRSSMKRSQIFKKKWENIHVVHSSP